MTSVIFVFFNNRACTIRRFLMVADLLADMNIRSFFLGSTSEAYGLLKKQAQQLGIHRLPYYISPDTFNSYAPEIQVKLQPAKPTMEDIFTGFHCSQEYPQNNKVGQLLNLLHINNKSLIGLHIEQELSRFVKNMRSAERLLEEIKPSCIIHDIELPEKNRSIFYTAQQKNISIISMLHGEGNAQQIDKLPVISDYYIAYGFYNYDILRGMGVEENRIFITGVPDTDLVYNYNREEIKKELTDKYNIDFNKKIVLIALRPNVSKAYSDLNTELLGILQDNKAENLEIVVKQHPVDKYSYVKKDYFNLYKSQHRNMKIIEGDFTISKLYAVSDYFITHKSSAIIEAILQNVSTIVIENNDAEWPDWNRYNIYMPVKIEDITGFLNEIKKGSYDEKAQKQKNNRDKFIRYFRYKFDNQATRRVANTISEIACKNKPRIIANTKYYKKSSEVLFRQSFKLLKRGKALVALKYLDEVCKDQSPLPGSHFTRAIALAQIGELNLAKDACQKELNLQPRHEATKKFLKRIEKVIAEYNNSQVSSITQNKTFMME